MAINRAELQRDRELGNAIRRQARIWANPGRGVGGFTLIQVTGGNDLGSGVAGMKASTTKITGLPYALTPGYTGTGYPDGIGGGTWLKPDGTTKPVALIYDTRALGLTFPLDAGMVVYVTGSISLPISGGGNQTVYVVGR